MTDDIEQKMWDTLQDIDYTIDLQNGDLTPVQEFYKNSKILITGCTGFLGNILLEKLMRSCPISTLYLLVRPKKGKNMKTRLDEIFDDPVFGRMKNHCPKFRDHLVGIEGDCLLPNLGLKPEDEKLLIDEVDIVFHVAATVRFDEKLKTAVAINIRATQDLLRLAKQMPKLKSFMHVSTAYCNCIHKSMEEKIYPPAINYKSLISMTENMSDMVLERITPSLLDKYPNTYTYTKQIAEDVVKQESHGLPVGIFRPAIVISTYKEPIRGWINNIYGPTGVILGAGVGLLRVLHSDSECNANLVPVDMCVNALILTAYEIGKRFENAKNDHLNTDIPVYNFESSNDQPINWGLFMKYSSKYGMLTPTTKSVWYYSFRLTKYYLLYMIMTFFLHTVPAYIIDGILLCSGKSPRMAAAYKKIHKFSSVISYFATKEWNFKSGNLQNIITRLTDKDRTVFFCDLKKLDWGDYFLTYTHGVRTYLLKDSVESMPAAKKRWNRMYWTHQIFKMVSAILLLWLIWSLFLLIFRLVVHEGKHI